MKPIGYVEEQLAQLWSELLGATEVAMEDSFVARGGDAGKAVQLAGRIRDVLGVTVESPVALAADTLESMAQRVRRDRTFRSVSIELRTSERGEAVAGGRDDPPPLSFSQQRLWFLQQVDPENTTYNVPTVLHLRGPLARAALGTALTELVNRHEALRTSFPAPRGRPHQLVMPAVPALEMPDIDLSGRAAAAAEAERIAAAEAATPFDIATGPLLRARLLRLAPQEHRLLLTFHHIAVDGWSLEIFYRELGEVYSAIDAGVTLRLPPVALRYTDYARWQREHVQGQVLDRLAEHWRTVLGVDPPLLDLPTDRPRPAHRAHRGAVATRVLGLESVARLREFNRRSRVTMSMTTLAAYGALLGVWAAVDQVTVGVPVSGRTRPESADLVGCLINMVPVRSGLSGDPGLSELVARTRTALLDATAHQDMPFDKLVEALVSRRNRDLSPVFRVIFSSLGQRRQPHFAGLDDCTLEIGAPPGTAKYDLSLYVEECGETLALTLEYDRDLYLAGTADALLVAYERTLAEAVHDPREPVRHLVTAALGGQVRAGSP